MTGAAVAGFVAAPFYTYIMERSNSWRTGWLVAGGLCAFGFVLTFFIANTPNDLGQYPDGVDPSESMKKGNTKQTHTAGPYKTKESWTLKEALRTRLVWLQLVCMIGQAWALYMVTVHGVLHLVDQNFSRMQAASIIGNLILFSGIARFPTGVLADRFEPRILSTFALLGMTVAIAGLWLAPTNMTYILLISALYGFCFGISTITFPMITANYFGPATFAPVVGFFMPFIIFASAPVPFIAGLIFDYYKSYDLAFLPVIVALGIATICAWFLFPPKKQSVGET